MLKSTVVVQPKKPIITISDLQSGAKKLEATEADSKSNKKSNDGENNAEHTKQLENLYEKYDGDLDRIFGELNADPTKAKKPHHRPKNKKEFAIKYIQGYYTEITPASSIQSESKDSQVTNKNSTSKKESSK